TLRLEASILAASLGQDCGAAASADARFAPPEADDAPGGAICAEDGECGGPSFCDQSNVTLALRILDAPAGTEPQAVEIVSLRLRRATDDTVAQDDVATRAPQRWDGSSYGDWDQRLAPGVDARVLYDVAGFDWSSIGEGDEWSTHAMSFVVEV